MAPKTPAAIALQRLDPSAIGAVVDVLVDAFGDYPVMRYVVGAGTRRDDPRLERLIRFFATSRVLRGEPMLGISDGGALTAVALVSDPAGPPSPPELGDLREEVWREVGVEARARYEEFGEAVRPLLASVPHIHLNMIGVRRSAQGRGYARIVLDEVHRISREHPHSTGVTLTTENPENVPLYEHFGYRVTGHARVSPVLETWAMFRRDG